MGWRIGVTKGNERIDRQDRGRERADEMGWDGGKEGGGGVECRGERPTVSSKLASIEIRVGSTFTSVA